MDIFTDILRIILTSLVSIAVLFCLCKLIGQRQISQMSMFDYINSITVGSIAAEFATELENWWEPLTATIVYGLVTVLINVITCKSIPLRKFFSGKPVVLFEEGKIYKANLMKAKMDVNEFLTQCRVAGYFDLSQLEAAVLETNGQISFLPKSGSRPVTPQDLQLTPEPVSAWYDLILDGQLMEDNLKASGRSVSWPKIVSKTSNVSLKLPLALFQPIPSVNQTNVNPSMVSASCESIL